VADDTNELHLQALRHRVHQLEQELARIREHIGLALPDRPSPAEHEVQAVRDLLAAGEEEEALRLHRSLTGQGDAESRETLESLRAGF
jgi:hypothetical protein